MTINRNIFFMMGIFYLVFSLGCQPQTQRSEDKMTVDVNDLIQNPWSYAGRRIETTAIIGEHVYVGSASGNVGTSLFLVRSVGDIQKIKPYSSDFNPENIALALSKNGQPMECTYYSNFRGQIPRTECSDNLVVGKRYAVQGIIKPFDPLDSPSGGKYYPYGKYYLDVISVSEN